MYSSGLVQRRDDIVQRKLTKAEAIKKLEAAKEKDLELIVGVFRYLEHPGSTLKFNFGRYQGDGFPQYALEDGKTYKLPRMVAKHLNTNIHYLKYNQLNGSDGVHAAQSSGNSRFAEAVNVDGKYRPDMTYVVKKIPRCEFRPLEFMEDDLELQRSNLVEVKTVS